VGTKIDLGFDVDTLRIFDLGEDDEAAPTATAGSTSSTIASVLNRKSTMSSSSNISADSPDEGAPAPKIRAETDSTKLRQFLNNLGGD
jgi:hypothetical protein